VKKNYKNLIFTDHALKRAKKRSLKQRSIYRTINHPDCTQSKTNKTTKYCKTIKTRKYQVVAQYLSKEKKYLVVSNWVRGEKDKLPLLIRMVLLPFSIVLWLLKKLLN